MRRRSRPRGLPARLGRWPLLRMRIAGLAIALLFVGMGARAWDLQVERADHYREAALRQHMSSQEMAAPRGVIRDTVGRELAVTADAPSIWADPSKVEDVAKTAEVLSKICGLDLLSLEEKLSSRRHFVWIRRHVSDNEAEALEATDLAGVYLSYEPRRYYPGRSLAGPVFGFANIDGVGIEGLELTMDELLRGRKSRRAAVRDARGGLMLTPNQETEPAEAGAAVTLTLDRSIQDIAQRALQRAVETHKAKAGSIVVLDVPTGGILAMANWPTYNPNTPSNRGQARNRSITDAFEMGSVMKLFTIAGALDAGAVAPDQVFDVEGGKIRIGRKVIRDSHHDDELDVAGILKRSSNVGTIKIARALGAERLYATLTRFGFGRTTGVELPGERSGLLHPTKRWGELGLASVSYGYMTLVTPLQVAAGYAAIANGGQYIEPRIVKRVVNPDGEVLYQHRPEKVRVISEETSRIVLPMMAGVFDKGRDGGTARTLDIDGYRAGGKTGTSHKVDPKTHTYSDDLYLSTFAGVAPIEAPRIAVVVMIDEPHGEEHYGALVAGPAFAEVVEGALRYLGIPAQASPQRGSQGAPAAEVGRAEADDGDPATDAPPSGARLAPGARAPESASGEGIPDFRGLSMARVVKRAAEWGIPVVFEGSGIAVEQSPQPGDVAEGVECRVVFAEPRAPRP